MHDVTRNAGIARIMHMSYRSKTYTWNDVNLVKRSFTNWCTIGQSWNCFWGFPIAHQLVKKNFDNYKDARYVCGKKTQESVFDITFSLPEYHFYFSWLWNTKNKIWHLFRFKIQFFFNNFFFSFCRCRNSQTKCR